VLRVWRQAGRLVVALLAGVAILGWIVAWTERNERLRGTSPKLEEAEAKLEAAGFRPADAGRPKVGGLPKRARPIAVVTGTVGPAEAPPPAPPFPSTRPPSSGGALLAESLSLSGGCRMELVEAGRPMGRLFWWAEARSQAGELLASRGPELVQDVEFTVAKEVAERPTPRFALRPRPLRQVRAGWFAGPAVAWDPATGRLSGGVVVGWGLQF